MHLLVEEPPQCGGKAEVLDESGAGGSPPNPPQWMVTGKTVLVPKMKAYSNDPSKYRPIACLNTCYNIYVYTLRH